MPTWTNFHGVAKVLDYILVSSSLVNAVIDDSVAKVEYFDTDYKAVSASMGLGGLLNIQLSSMCKQANKNHWKFDVKSVDEAKWSEFKITTAANVAMFLDKFGLARRFSDLNAIWDIVHKIMIFLANGMFKKKWFKGYDGVFTKEFSKLHNLEILVSKIVKASREVDSGQFESLLKCWVSLDSDKASVVQNLVSSGASLNYVHFALCGIRRSYYASKLAESLRAEKLGIRSAIERKIKNFVVNNDHTICSVLECPFHKVVLDYLVFDSGLILDPIKVKNKVDGIMESWTRKRAVLKSIPNLCAFFGVMNAIGLDDLTYVIKDLLNSKAAGLSGISNKLWKHCDDSVLGLLLDLLNTCWCVSQFPISVLTNTRLIALIETACKIFSKLLSDKILLVCSLFNVLHRDNFSVLKNTTTQSSIFAIGSVVKDVLEKDRELWLVLQDMHKVYNSVNWYHLHNSLVRIKMCEHFIRFFGSESLCKYQIDTKFVARTGRVENQSSLTLFLVTGAFIDNTIWYILDTASEFFRVNDISINNEKTVAIPINQRVSDTLLLINDLPILVACKKKFHQYFGIYLSFESLSKSSLAKAHTNIRFFVNLVLKKTISNKQFLYLVLVVLQPIINYRTQFSFVSKNVCMRWDTLIRRGLKLKAGLPRDFSNEALHHLSLYDLKSFEQLQTECKIASVLGWLPIHSLCHLIKLCINPVNNFLAGVIRIFLDYNMSLNNLSVSAFHFSGRTPIFTVLEASLFYDISSFLKRFGVAFAEQLYIKKGLSSVFHWFTLVYDFLGLWTMDVCSLSVVSRLGQCLSSANMRVISVYTDGLLRDLGLCEIKCGAAAYFSNLGLDISAKIGGIVSSIMAELQTIVLALECVSPNSLVVVYSDSQAVLDVCVAESALVSLDFHNHYWMKWHGIVNLIKRKQLDVFWHKVKGHSGVVGNKRANKLTNLAVGSTLVLLVLVKEKFVKTGPPLPSTGCCAKAFV
ncbi:hypothetical protein G9A89_002696 [Geosiphon pyriformis]|nr:hypothetical protein G9A89_002696 [Geosiphon pyriformis]